MTKEQVDKILSLLCEITIYAHRDKIYEEAVFTYSPKIHKKIASVVFGKSSLISYRGMTVTKSGGTYWLKFEALDKLKNILEAANLPTKFTTLLVNSKFSSSFTIDRHTDFKKVFYCSLFADKFDTESIHDDSANAAIADIEKLILFKKIAYA